MAREYIMTQETYDGLQQRLAFLKNVARKEVSKKIGIARDFGDLSENAEYDAAKEEQAQIEGEILSIDEKLNNAKIISPDEVNKSTVGIGCKVRLHDLDDDEEVEYSIVGTTEVDIDKNKISNESPIGKALIGKKKGDEVIVQTARSEIKFKILRIF